MIRFRPLILALLLVCGAVAAHSQDIVRLTPDDAVDLAIKNNLSLESARVTLDTKKRKSDLVWNQFLPSIDARGTLARDNWASTSQSLDYTALPSIVMTSTTLPQWHVNANISAAITFSFALVEGIKSIKLDYQTGLVTLEKARLQTERDVRKSYNQILLLHETVALQQKSLATAERRYNMAEANYKAGLVPRLSALQAQVALENMKPSINELENNLKALEASFAMSLGLPYETQFELAPMTGGDFYIPLDVAELISKAASGKPDILELQKSIQALRSGRKALALQLYTPYLAFAWNISSMYSPMLDPFKDKLFTTDNWNKGGTFSVTLGMSLNSLLPFTKEGQSLKDMDNNVRSLNIGLAQAIRGTELEIYNKVNSLEKTRTTAEAQKLTVDMAQQSYQLTEEAYRAGLQDFLEVQNAALSLNQAELQLLTQQFNYLSDLIDLEYATGVPFGTLSSKNGN
ncbi:TolC family protein [Leadbettera azotonutricia]|uniref:Outer membrane efflux protein n=1 Tax=Leadbettera azotonutricia (strain ATCC BAA-888 / DSM 13862 / ZAS-9) TaxID=545695 RepID=F5YC02_LEAAZ|nr:TolC family protein [Leadbettera azotonutricia]AEF82095.1 outer membrane efflux protein [Leadbettera azotonutricia ZAS-9]